MTHLNRCRQQNVLLLQGPMGPFFRRLADDLIDHGAKVFKINFNGGDCLFYWKDAVSFYGNIDDWADFLTDFLERNQIEKIFLFGDCRVYHRFAINIAKIKQIEVLVFEEGYYRPNYITIEFGGVNSHSKLSKNPEFYRGLNSDSISPVSDVGNYFAQVAFYSYIYYLVCILTRVFFSNYQHHRALNSYEFFRWVRSYWVKITRHFRERTFMDQIVIPNKGNLFVVPLQVNTDSQILFHSNYSSNKDFIKHIIYSFKNNAPPNTKLIFKHHPLDRAYHNYEEFIRNTSLDAEILSRVFYVFEQRLPTLYLYARGVVVINSTSGLSAMDHRLAVKACGDSIYCINGMKFIGTLDNFWKKAHLFKIDQDLYIKFKAHVINETQVNGNFYKRIKSSPLRSGLMF